jgi:tryptophan halogenase
MKSDFIILGGGTAGLISALMLKQAYPEKKITIIKSDDIGIIGVGEGSTKEFTAFINFIGVKPYDLILNTGSTFKSGIYFSDWSEQNFLHTRSAFHDQNWLSTKPRYLHHISYTPDLYLSDKCYHDNEFYPDFLDDPNKSPSNQYHFDTFKFNDYFLKLAADRGVAIVEDTIKKVQLNDLGLIRSLHGEDESKTYEADFYLDCTGFKRLLNQSDWVSYSDKLILNKAVAFQTAKMNEYNAWTLAKKYKGGWRWQIPTQDRTGNGIVYHNDLIDDEIKKLIDLGKREFNFYPGRLKKIWNKNVLSVGLSAMFVEPLEATSIGSTINQMFLFLEMYHKKDITSYNKIINNVFEQLVEFIQLHYFGSDLSGDLSDDLKEKIKKWYRVLPTDADVNVPFGLFESGNYIEVLHGLRFFDQNSIKECFLNLPINIKNAAIEESSLWFLNNMRTPKIGHKAAIDLIRSTYK